MDKITHRHNINHHKMSASLNLLLQYKTNLFLVFKSTAPEMHKSSVVLFFPQEMFSIKFYDEHILCIL